MKICGWTYIGTIWHWRWRSGKTWLDNAGGNMLLMHHGFYSIEWVRA